jgi:glycosyltransferase involved in cell wall biosynthesis
LLRTTPLLASVFLPSYNKRLLAVEAIESVLAQDHEDFELWVLENSTDGVTRDLVCEATADDPRVSCEHIDLTDGDRAAAYPPAMLLNRYYPKACGRYIFYLSDDDLLEPQCLSRVIEFMEADPARQVCYFSLRIEAFRSGEFVQEGGIAAEGPMGFGTDSPIVDSRIDGGQIAHTKACLDRIDWPWFPENPNPATACHADGLFMQKLAWHYTFHPLHDHLATHRRTPLSAWGRSG